MFCPSAEIFNLFVLSADVISIFSLEGTTSGRAFNECGQIGTIINAFNLGTKIGPPAEMLYAVEPVGVETIKPSAS